MRTRRRSTRSSEEQILLFPAHRTRPGRAAAGLPLPGCPRNLPLPFPSPFHRGAFGVPPPHSLTEGVLMCSSWAGKLTTPQLINPGKKVGNTRVGSPSTPGTAASPCTAHPLVLCTWYLCCGAGPTPLCPPALHGAAAAPSAPASDCTSRSMCCTQGRQEGAAPHCDSSTLWFGVGGFSLLFREEE